MTSVTVFDPRRQWAFVAACALAGALAVPPHVIVTPTSAALAGLIGRLGLYAWKWSGLSQHVRRDDAGGPRRLLVTGALVGLGLLVGLFLLGVIRLAIEPVIPAMGARMAAAGDLPVWRRLLVIYVAAVGEELLLRLILMSVVTGLLMRLIRAPSPAPNPGVVWTANVISAVAFAAIHLPSWSGVESSGPWLALSVLALNAAGSLVFGHVFATRGIVAAILTHAGADCAIQLIGPLTG